MLEEKYNREIDNNTQLKYELEKTQKRLSPCPEETLLYFEMDTLAEAAEIINKAGTLKEEYLSYFLEAVGRED